MTVSSVSPPRGDPRDEVTEFAFRVDPELVGLPLARPGRRAVALLVDGIAVAILANAPTLVFGLGIGYVLLRAATRPSSGRRRGRAARIATAALALVIILSAVRSLVTSLGGEGDGSGGSVRLGEGEAVIEGIPGLLVGADMLALVRSASEPDARGRAEALVEELRRVGVTDAEIAEILNGLRADAEERPWVRAAIDSTAARLADVASAQAVERATLARSAQQQLDEYVRAVTAGDSSEATGLRSGLGALLAADTVASLEGQLAAATSRVERLETSLESAERNSGMLAVIRTLLDDLGLGFGWGGLYFTAFTTLWRGMTPGKRLLGIRAVRLDGAPIGWWNAFERFAGYAAGLATGLLGFIQIYWDRNRQGIQDKIAGTVVIRERARNLTSGRAPTSEP